MPVADGRLVPLPPILRRHRRRESTRLIAVPWLRKELAPLRRCLMLHAFAALICCAASTILLARSPSGARRRTCVYMTSWRLCISPSWRLYGAHFPGTACNDTLAAGFAMTCLELPAITLWQKLGGKDLNFIFHDDNQTMIVVWFVWARVPPCAI